MFLRDCAHLLTVAMLRTARGVISSLCFFSWSAYSGPRFVMRNSNTSLVSEIVIRPVLRKGLGLVLDLYIGMGACMLKSTYL